MKRKLIIVIDQILFLIFLSVSTEIFAFLCHYSPVLGPKDFIILYAPYNILVWPFTVEVNGNQFLIAYIVLLIPTLCMLIISIYLYRQVNKNNLNIHGSSRWSLKKELKKSKLLKAIQTNSVIAGQTYDAEFEKKEEEIYKFIKQGDIIYCNDKVHMLITAPTGEGKGITFVIPTLLGAWFESVIVIDIKKENWDITAGFRRGFSNVIRYEPASPTSARYNPLLEIEKGSKEIGQAQNIAQLIYDPGELKLEHWDKNAIILAAGIILHILYSEEDKSLAGMYDFVNNPEREFIETLNIMIQTNRICSKETNQFIAQSAKNMLNKSDRELAGVHSTFSTALALYQDTNIRRNVSVSDFTAKQIMNSAYPMSLYIVISPNDIDRMQPLVRLIIQTIVNVNMQGLNRNKHSLLVLYDEFCAFGRQRFIETILAYSRGYKIKFALVVQSYSQLKNLYGVNTSIMDNCATKLFLGASSKDAATEIENLLGKETITVRNKSQSGERRHFLKSNESISETQIGRSLLTTDEILHLPYDELILFYRKNFPYRGKKIMYYLDPRFKDRANLPAPNSWEEQKQEFIEEENMSPWLKEKEN